MRLYVALALTLLAPQIAAAQTRYMTGLISRAATGAIVMTAMSTKLQADALAPIHKTATANAKRLNK